MTLLNPWSVHGLNTTIITTKKDGKYFDLKPVDDYIAITKIVVYLFMGPKGIGKTQNGKKFIRETYLIPYHEPPELFAWVRTKDKQVAKLKRKFLSNCPTYQRYNPETKLYENARAYAIDGEGYVIKKYDDSNDVVGLILGLSVWENFKSTEGDNPLYGHIIYDEFNQTDEMSTRELSNFFKDLLAMFHTFRRENVSGKNRTRLIILGNQDTDNNFILNSFEEFGFDNDIAIDYLYQNQDKVYTWLDNSGYFAVSIAGCDLYPVDSNQSNDPIKRWSSASSETNAFFNSNSYGKRMGTKVYSLGKFENFIIIYRFVISTVDSAKEELCYCDAWLKQQHVKLWVNLAEVIRKGFEKEASVIPSYSLSRIGDFSQTTEILDVEDLDDLREQILNDYRTQAVYYNNYLTERLVHEWMVLNGKF